MPPPPLVVLSVNLKNVDACTYDTYLLAYCARRRKQTNRAGRQGGARERAKKNIKMPLRLPSRTTYKNTWGVILGTFLVAAAFLVTELLSLLFKSSSVVEEVWTAEDLSSMAGSSTVAAAVGYLTSVSVRSRAFEREYDE